MALIFSLRSMEEKILTLHPQRKRGVNISRTKYETMKRTILEVLGKGNLTHEGFTAAVETALKGKFDGSIPWYMEGTKLDLEARGIIAPLPGQKHDIYRVKR